MNSLMLFLIFHVKASTEEERLAFRKELQQKYQDHIIYDYYTSRSFLYSYPDCSNNKLSLLYTYEYFDFECHLNKIPDSKLVNAEHIVPQSFFKSLPEAGSMVADLHHIYASGAKVNNARGNMPFTEINPAIEHCSKWCLANECSKNISELSGNYSDFSCVYKSKFVPIPESRGKVARAVLYFFTIYHGTNLSISRVGDVNLFLKWNKEYPPTVEDIKRNNRVNITQGNRNPYVDHPEYADMAFP